jgi:hypothetical protein
MADFGERYVEALRQQPNLEWVERQESETAEEVSGEMTVSASTLFDAQDRVGTAMHDAWRLVFSTETVRPRQGHWGHSNLEPIEAD